MRFVSLCLLVSLSPCLLVSRALAQDAKGIQVDKVKKTVTVDAKIAPRKMEDPKFEGKIYPIEVIACWEYPKGQKAHETVVTIDVKPGEVHKALESLGLKAGKTADVQNDKPAEGPELNVYIEFAKDGGAPRRLPIGQLLLDIKTGKPLGKGVRFRFTGSEMIQPDPTKPEKVYAADRTGTLIAIFPVTASTMMQSNLSMKEEKYVKLETDQKTLPPVGTPVKLILEAAK